MIKLENIMKKQYNRQTGELEVEERIEFACSKCRHLLEQNDLYCWFCGKELDSNMDIEHYVLGEKLTNDEFLEAKTKSITDLNNFISAIKSHKKT